MVYNTQNYWGFGLCPQSGIVNTSQYIVSKTVSVSILKRGGKAPTLFGPLERANLNHWCLLSHLRKETDPVSEMICFLVFRITDAGHGVFNEPDFFCGHLPATSHQSKT
jgi:hypothetical protein